MAKLFISAFILLISLSAFSNSESITVLRKKAYFDKNDSTRIYNFSELCFTYISINSDSAIFYGKEGLKLATSKKYRLGQRQCYTDLGIAYRQTGNYPEAIKCFLNGLKIAEELHHEKYIINNLSNLGVVYHNIKNYSKAIEYYSKALEYDKKTNDLLGMSLRLNNIGVLYKETKNIAKAESNLKKALELANQTKDSISIARALNNIAEVYDLKGEKKLSLHTYLRAYKIQRALNNSYGVFLVTSNLAQQYAIANKLDSSFFYSEIAFDLAQQLNSTETYLSVYNMLASVYAKAKKFDKAYYYQSSLMLYKDSIYNLENSKLISDLKTKYEVDKKAAELNAINAAEKSKIEAVRQEEQKRHFATTLLILIILVLAILFSIVLYKRFKLISKQKGIIELQKQIVEQKNKEVYDSIAYAKRLQNAILPSEKFWKENLPNSFVYYLPKDIVAGDFFFMEKMENILYVAAADCTGHGVPGAMVSVVCSNALHRTINELKIKNTGDILNKTRELIIETFQRSGEEVKDGMDISLCAIEKSANGEIIVQWSGANNPLLYSKEGSIHQLEPDKQPVGLSHSMSPFKSNQIKLQPNDSIYLITDGFADQFGGDKGKKFKLKNLKNLFSQINQLKIEHQFDTLHSAFSNWKGDIEQLDDICIIGIKF